jgi:hypothetical protein
VTGRGPRVALGLLAVAVAALGCLWPLRAALVTGELPGAGPDVVSTTWGAWWLGQVGPAGLFGVETTLVNHPGGAVGSLLSPLTTGAQALLTSTLGVGWALSVVAVVHALALAGAVGWLAHAGGARGPAAVVAAAAVLVGRYLPFGLGEGSIVAIAALPVPLGLIALLRLSRGGGWVAVAAVAACSGWAAIENPYLAPVLPGVAAALALGVAPARRRLVVALATGAIAVLAVVAVFKGGASPDYPREVDGTALTLAGWRFTVVDLPWSRVRPWEVVWGGPVRWTLQSDAAVSAGGGRTFGLSVLALAAVGAVRRPRQALPWCGLAFAMLVLAAGSSQADVGLPFLYLNHILDAVARPLTQPVRFLAVALVAVAVAAGHGAAALARHRWALPGVLALFAVESAALGAGSLRLPTTALPAAPCLAELPVQADKLGIPDGAALAWPWDARDGEASRSQLLQMVHGRAAAHRGIASWAHRGSSAQDALRGAGFRQDRPPGQRLEVLPLRMLGFQWVFAETAADPAGVARLRQELGGPVLQCGDVAVFSLGR